jgi:peptidoglycan/LPS O-acetylase OafA/YrhL
MDITPPPPPRYIRAAALPPEVSPPRYDALDGLRGIAAFLVAFVYHYSMFSPETLPFAGLLYWPYHFGWTLIDLFYVLSGFIFFQKYGRSIASHSFSLKKYCVLRFSRLYPLHWLMLLVVAFFVLFRQFNGLSYFPFDGAFKYSPLLFLLNIPLMQYGWFYSAYKSFNGNAWTLSIEVMMYLLFFALAYFSRSVKGVFLGGVVFVCVGVLLGALKQFGFDFPILGVCQGMIGFFMGCVTAGIFNFCCENGVLRRVFTFISVGLILLALFLSFAVIFLPFFSGILLYSSMGYWVLVYSFMLFPSLIFLCLRFKLLYDILSLGFLRYLGRISFSIYLIHFPAALIITSVAEFFHLGIDYSSKFVFFAFMVLVLFLSTLSHFYFEMPIQTRIRRRPAALQSATR